MKKITFVKRILQGLCCESKAEASLLCFTGCVWNSSVPAALGAVGSGGHAWGPGGSLWGPVDTCGVWWAQAASPQCTHQGLPPFGGCRITSVLLSKMASAFGAERN